MQTLAEKYQEMQPTPPRPREHGPLEALAGHWQEYLMEATLLACFMLSACVFAVLLEHPASPLHRSVENPLFRRMLMGLAMGTTLVAIVYSPLGQRSGAHMNPSLTLTYFTLGKIARWDTIFYVVAQSAGGALGVFIAAIAIGRPLSHDAVNYAVTVPGPSGAWAAFVAECLISMLMTLTVLTVSNTRSTTRYTGLVAGGLVMTFITVEAPYSGMSMNPARTLGSALLSGEWRAFWVYLTAPLLAMTAAGQLFRWRNGAQAVFCAKLHHHNAARCIFRCNYGAINGK